MNKPEIKLSTINNMIKVLERTEEVKLYLELLQFIEANKNEQPTNEK